jgi:prepilin-type N-terminal cleavage/methylation domain-containing protein
MARKASCLPVRSGYTLLELLIVLALLAALTGLSWPSVRGMLAKSQLRAAAKQVRVALATARWKAIESGEPQRFRYAPGASWFEVGPLHPSQDEPDPPVGKRQGPAPAQKTTLDFLPRGIWFAEPAASDPQTIPSTPSEANDEDRESRSVVFHPNGRSSQARIVLEATNGLTIEVVLRGLTGTTRIGPLEQRERQP